MKKNITAALTGNPNSGKTTIFNALTGARQKIGNYPGVTVEKKEGRRLFEGSSITFIDLPGTYSLTAYSVEELTARNYIMENSPDVVVDIIDSSNLERNLYMAVQLMEMQVPLVLAFNMSDLARQRGMVFDLELLSELLGVPIVPMTGRTGEGLEQLLSTVKGVAEGRIPSQERVIHYGREIEQELEHIGSVIDTEHDMAEKYSVRWLSVKLLEQDKEILKKGHTPEVLDAVSAGVERLKAVFNDPPDVLIADKRYGFISGACQESVQNTIESRHDYSDKIDSFLINRILGLPIFMVMMYLVFYLTFTLGQYPMSWLETALGWFSGAVSGLWPAGSESLLRSLAVEGVIGGVGGVIVFLPNILLLFLGIAVLEDSGYMARAAFLMDRIMHKIGLHGKSFIPMLVGFGCSVPAIMGTRILENRKNRIATMMVIPLMSCGARLPIYSLIIPAFFAVKWRGPILFVLYFSGVLLAIVIARILKGTVLKGESSLFVMELPPYRMPTARGLLIHMWERGREYVKKAGTILLAIAVIMWAASTFPQTPEDQVEGLSEEQAAARRLENSVTGRVGRLLEPALRPLGFDYRIGTALIGALAAKEVFVAQMAIVYSVSEQQSSADVLRERLRRDYSAIQGFCIMLFCLISAPCVATTIITAKESGSWKWALLQFAGLTLLAYIITLTVYQLGSLITGG